MNLHRSFASDPALNSAHAPAAESRSEGVRRARDLERVFQGTRQDWHGCRNGTPSDAAAGAVTVGHDRNPATGSRVSPKRRRADATQESAR